jgi:very-short-patch-repair endonuclease
MAEPSADERHDALPARGGRDVVPLHAAERHGDADGSDDCDVVPLREAIGGACARHGRGQQGCVTHAQLVADGISRHVISRAASAGLLHRRHRGVYIVGHLALAPYALEAAALLACGDSAVISHRSAAYLWGLIDRPAEVDVTIVGGQRRPQSGMRIHRVKDLDSRDLRRRHGLPITSPARTVVDLAAAAGEYELERIIAEGRGLRLIGDGELERALERSGSRPGNGTLRALLRAEGEPGITRSEGERTLRRYLRAAQLPQPLTNRKLGKWEPDFLWPAHRVVVELDSWQFHSHRKAFERDRRKDMALRDAGYTVIRITGRQLTDEPLMVIAHVARALDRATRPHG